MSNYLSRLMLVLMIALMTAGCELAGGIFKAGMWVGMLMVILAVGLVLFLVAKVRG
jgi:hypothetical protein